MERVGGEDRMEACVEHMGPGGAGHYVKMVHNGIGESSAALARRVVCLVIPALAFAGLVVICSALTTITEHTIMSILCEVRSLLYHNLGYTDDEISALFEKWDKDPESPLRGNFLIGIG